MRTSPILLVLVAMVPGCTLSVHPILTDADLTKDLDLSGTWQQQMPPGDNPEAKPIVISCDGYGNNTAYDAVYEEHGQEFDVRIGKIANGRYLQFIFRRVPSEKENRNEDPHAATPRATDS